MAYLFPSDRVYPPELPKWLISGHAIDAVAISEDAQMEAGEDLVRQLYTWVPQIVHVSTILEQPEFDRFDQWFEEELLAGTRVFDNEVAGQGGTALAWWTAQFIGGYQWETMPHNRVTHENRYRVSAQLLLLDGPYSVRNAPELRALFEAASTLEARMPTDTQLRGLFEVTATLSAFIGEPGDRITEDAEDRITEDGETRSLES